MHKNHASFLPKTPFPHDRFSLDFPAQRGKIEVEKQGRAEA
jgi:hypothetical protein